MTTQDTTCPKRLQDAVEAAEIAFFTALAQAYPEIKTGDLDPMIANAFTQACKQTAIAWVEGNETSEDP